MTVEVRGSAPVKYVKLNEGKVKCIVNGHLVKGEVAEDYALVIGSESSY